ncbi:hypothetical protein, partial [Staphylococcus sp. HMSC055A10]|uniref:hypothetical protein n=1 Tax=Staphylococcus sp. HMSC055A10 TaxID=1739509 RepID=UPI001C57A280
LAIFFYFATEPIILSALYHHKNRKNKIPKEYRNLVSDCGQTDFLSVSLFRKFYLNYSFYFY